jgi:hypothetical protein
LCAPKRGSACKVAFARMRLRAKSRLRTCVCVPLGVKFTSLMEFDDRFGDTALVSVRVVRVFKGEEDDRKPPALRAGHPRNGCKAVSGVVLLLRFYALRKRVGMAGPGETLGSPWSPLAIRPSQVVEVVFAVFVIMVIVILVHVRALKLL